MTLPIILRPMHDGDLGFVIETWLRSNRRGGGYHGEDCSDPVYWHGQRRLVDRLLSTCTTMVAESTTEANLIAGWICRTPETVHYAYVRGPFRRMGVFRLLLGTEIPRTYSHRTGMCTVLRIPDGTVFDPYAVLGEL